MKDKEEIEYMVDYLEGLVKKMGEKYKDFPFMDVYTELQETKAELRALKWVLR